MYDTVSPTKASSARHLEVVHSIVVLLKKEANNLLKQIITDKQALFVITYIVLAPSDRDMSVAKVILVVYIYIFI